MKTLIGLILLIGGVILGLYVGVWVCLIGGIIQVVTVIRAPELDAVLLAYGIARILCSGLAGTLSFVICSGLGMAFLKD